MVYLSHRANNTNSNCFYWLIKCRTYKIQCSGTSIHLWSKKEKTKVIKEGEQVEHATVTLRTSNCCMWIELCSLDQPKVSWTRHLWYDCFFFFLQFQKNIMSNLWYMFDKVLRGGKERWCLLDVVGSELWNIKSSITLSILDFITLRCSEIQVRNFFKNYKNMKLLIILSASAIETANYGLLF